MWFKPVRSAKSIALSKAHKAECRKKGRWVCAHCGYTGEDMQSDHILPFKYYPELDEVKSNRQLLCAPCNQKKAAKILTDYPTAKIYIGLSFRYAIKRLILVTIFVIVTPPLLMLFLAGQASTPSLYDQYQAGALKTFLSECLEAIRQS